MCISWRGKPEYSERYVEWDVWLCMYSGDRPIEKCKFRDMYKLSSAFKTNRLTDRRGEYFYLLCENVSHEFEDLLFVFIEVLYAKSIHKTVDLISKVTDRFSEMENIENMYVKRYLHENYSSIKSETLEIVLLISKDVSPVHCCSSYERTLN